jgi:DNA-binding transcriptional LysR family regulator
MRSLNLDHLQTLMEVVALGSFSAAARQLNLSQPAVSLQIRELEARCGVRLIERSGKHVLPTAAGRDLIAHAERIRGEAERALAAMRRHKGGHIGRVHLGAGPTALAYLLPPVLQRLREKYPEIDLVVTTGTTHDIAEQIQANRFDLGFTALPVDGDQLVTIPVRTDPMVAILPATDADIPAAITPADVDRRPLILEYQRVPHGQLSRAWLRAAGIEVRPMLEFNTIEAITSAVAAGLGMAIIPSPAVTHGPPLNSIVVRPLDPPLVRTLGLVQRRDKPDNPALRAVRDEIMTLANAPAPDSMALVEVHHQDDGAEAVTTRDKDRRLADVDGKCAGAPLSTLPRPGPGRSRSAS